VARSTPKRRAVSALGTPFFTDSMIFSLRSSEYALMHPRYPAHPHRNLLLGRCNFDYHTGATWRPRSPAASTATCWLEIVRTCVMVPIKTENGMRFSVRLHDGASEVRFERVSVS
jgi:hypothetical protein